nr:FAD-dependent oxidoreductase [Natrinema hispanicum]
MREQASLTLFKERAEFVDERTVELDGQAVTAENVVVATGSRPAVPPIDGLEECDYLTSNEALYLTDPPESLVVLGGGYIAVELGYVFGSIGTDVTIIEKNDSLVSREDGAVAATLTEIASDRHEVHTGHRVTAVEALGDGYRVHAETEAGERSLSTARTSSSHSVDGRTPTY